MEGERRCETFRQQSQTNKASLRLCFGKQTCLSMAIGSLVQVSHSASVTALLLPQQEVNAPASAPMRAGAAQVFEDVGVSATGVFKGVGEDSETVGFEGAFWKLAVLIASLRQRDNHL